MLDFACGVGVLSVWLADRGAAVTGIDVSARSVDQARELAERSGAAAEFVVGEISALAGSTFDRVAGRYALHHVDIDAVAPALASVLRPGGTAAFVETMATNSLLPFLRRHVAGRFGVPRYGTEDEHPITAADIACIERAFGGPVSVRVGEVVFLRLFDRQILHFRSRTASRVLGATDDLLQRAGRERWSYHQVLVAGKPA